MNEQSLLGPWIRRFLLEHLVNERNLAPNTQRSYRDTFCLLIPFAAEQLQRKVDKIKVTEISAALVRKFLTYLKEVRHCGTNTHNQRLAAIHALAVFIGNRSPEHLAWCREVRAVPFKKSARTVVHYLDKLELDAMLAVAKQRQLTSQGQRDYAMLLFLYNTGARADEAARLTIADLHLAPADWNGQAYVQIRGKGGRTRQCPLWPATVREIENSIGKRLPHEHVFLTRLLRPYTRVGVYELVKRYGQRAALAVPSIATKQVSPHIIRHSTAMHLLRAGVDINTIRGWLGHVSLSTTNIYAEIDLEMKAKALGKCEVTEESRQQKHWRDQPSLMEFLRTL
jgi:site-specific recombinase XerD